MNDDFSYEELNNSMPTYFHDYTRLNMDNNTDESFFKQSVQNFINILDLTSIKEDIVNMENLKWNKKIYCILPSHVVSIRFVGVKNIQFLFFPQSLLRITLGNNLWPLDLEGSFSSIPDLPNNLIYLDLSQCRGISRLPNLPNTLKYLNVNGIPTLEILPMLPDGLMILKCMGTTIRGFSNLPDSIKHLDFGYGGKDVYITLPKKWPANLKYLTIGAPSPDYLINPEEFELEVRENPEDHIDPNEEGIITEERITQYISDALEENKGDFELFMTERFTNVTNPNDFPDLPDNLSRIVLGGTNIANFPSKLPKNWKNMVPFEINIQMTDINLLQFKYLNMLENLDKENYENKVKFNYGRRNYNTHVNIKELLDFLRKKQHSAFNISIGSKNQLVSTNKEGKKQNITHLSPEISTYLSSDENLQKNTIKYTNNNKGGRKKLKTLAKRTRTKKRKRKITRITKKSHKNK
jgi:hypothetical protein